MSLIIFLLVLSVLVLVHEAGHYLAARAFGVKAEEFGYGFPPRFFGFVRERGRWKKIGRKDRGPYPGTIWSINWLPLGGFVRIKGEQADGIHDPDSFHMKPVWQRFIILAAGVAMNWLLAFVLFTAVFSVGTLAVIEDLPPGAAVTDRHVAVTQVLPDSPAARAGVEPGDEIVSVAGTGPASAEDARIWIGRQGDAPFHLRVKRDERELDLEATLSHIKEIGRLGLGVGLADVGRVSFPLPSAIRAAGLATVGYTKAVLLTFRDLFRDLLSFRAPVEEVSGPVGIAVMSGRIARQGIVPLLQFAAVLSINLAVVNFLPIPALDGGRAVFLFIEKFRRRPMSRPLEAAIHNIAFIILVLLILLVTVRDVTRYGGVIVGGVRGLVGM